MTFEARDSAAKVMPARFRLNQSSTLKNPKNQRNRKSTYSQTSKWDHQLGLFRTNRSPSPSLRDSSRRQQKAEFLQFSKILENKGIAGPMKKSPSAPTLADKKSPSRRTRSPRFATAGGCALLNPELLKRHAVSVDNPGYSPQQVRYRDCGFRERETVVSLQYFSFLSYSRKLLLFFFNLFRSYTNIFLNLLFNID